MATAPAAVIISAAITSPRAVGIPSRASVVCDAIPSTGVIPTNRKRDRVYWRPYEDGWGHIVDRRWRRGIVSVGAALIRTESSRWFGAKRETGEQQGWTDPKYLPAHLSTPCRKGYSRFDPQSETNITTR